MTGFPLADDTITSMERVLVDRVVAALHIAYSFWSHFYGMATAMNSSSSQPTASRRNQLLMVGNGSLGILFGLLAGYGLIFSVLGAIEIWPFISIDAKLPGSSGAWRAAHTGPMMNGLLCIAGAFSLSLVTLTEKQEKLVTYGLIFTVWANICFYVFSIFGNAHGLTGGTSERFGASNIFDLLAFLPALVGAVITPVCMFVLARAAFSQR